MNDSDGVRVIDHGTPPARFARGWHCLGLADRFLARADSSEQIDLWELPSGKYLPPLPAQRLSVFQVVFSPDGRWLVASTRDGVRVYDVSAFVPVHVRTALAKKLKNLPAE